MNEIETIKTVLLKWTTPSIDGMSSHEIATLIVQALRERETNGIADELVKKCEHELKDLPVWGRYCKKCGAIEDICNCCGNKGLCLCSHPKE